MTGCWGCGSEERACRHPVLPLDGEGGPSRSAGLEGVRRASVSSSTAYHPLRLARSGDPPRLSRARTHPASHRHPTVAAKPRSGGPYPPGPSFCLRRLAQAINRKAEVPRMPAARSPWDDWVWGCGGEERACRHPVLPLDGEGGPAQSAETEGVRRASVPPCTAHHPLRLARSGDPPRLSRARTHPASHRHPTVAASLRPGDQPGQPRSPGCPLRGHRGMTGCWR
jgi:hypothetical protein